jgi:hypothetical protein
MSTQKDVSVSVDTGAHPRRHQGSWPALRQPPKTKWSTDYVGGPSRKIGAKGLQIINTSS